MGRTMGSKNCQNSATRYGATGKQYFNGKKSPAGSKFSSSGNNLREFGECCAESITDRSQTNFPFDIRISGFSSLMNTVTKSTPKVQKLILDECDIILECRVCRNLFRSLPNFLTHKQSFCKKEFHPSANAGFSQFLQVSNNSYEFQYHLDGSLLDSQPVSPSAKTHCDTASASVANVSNFASANVSDSNNSFLQENGTVQKMSRLHKILSRVAPAIEQATRTPSSLYSDIIMSKKVNETSASRNIGEEYVHKGLLNGKVQMLIEPLDKSDPGASRNGIVFQKTIGFDPSNCDVSDPHLDTRKIVQPDSAVLGPDGKIICVGNSDAVEKIVNKVIAQVEEMQEEQLRHQADLNCVVCLTQFPTSKALRMHVRTAHRMGPDQNVDASLLDSKLVVEQPPDLSDEASVISGEKISPPPAKKRKSASPVDLTSSIERHSSDSSDHILHLSPAKSSTLIQSELSSSLPVVESVKLYSAQPRNFVNGAPVKRPRGRPRKVSLIKSKHESSKQGVHKAKVSEPAHNVNDFTNHLKKPNVATGSYTSEHNQSVSQSVSGSLTCGKCSAKFGTKCDMSMHLAHCAGVINYAFLQNPKSPDSRNKISIQIRRDYVKPAISLNTTTGLDNGKQVISQKRDSNDLNSYEKRNSSIQHTPGWTRWNHQECTVAKNSSATLQNSSRKSLTLEECIEIAQYQIYNKNSNCPSRSAFSGHGSNNDNHSKYNGNQVDDDEQEAEDDAEVEGLVGEETSPCSSSSSNNNSDSSEDDGLPDDDEKNSNHEHDADIETDRDSNVTDSGVSTTSVMVKHVHTNIVPPTNSEIRNSKNKNYLDTTSTSEISDENAVSNTLISGVKTPARSKRKQF